VAQQQPQVDKIKLQRQIGQLEEMLKTAPDNYEAWKKLGDSYFDIQESNKAIEAYRKALDLDQSDPNVWTDMGIMYRQIGDSTKALEAFEEAVKRGPNHATSRLNKGVVYIFDLQDYEKGIAAWEEFLKLQPTGQRADQVRMELEQIRQMQKVQATGGELPPDHPPIDGSGQPAGGDAPAPAPAPATDDPASYFPKPEAQ
jgi:tetratricopeptide (TPR) repeat protein